MRVLIFILIGFNFALETCVMVLRCESARSVGRFPEGAQSRLELEKHFPSKCVSVCPRPLIFTLDALQYPASIVSEDTCRDPRAHT